MGVEGSGPSSVALHRTAGPLLSPGSAQSAPLGPWEDPPRLRAAWEPRRSPVLEEEPGRGPLGGKGATGLPGGGGCGRELATLEEVASTAHSPAPQACPGVGVRAGAGPRGSARARVPSKSLSPNKTPLPAPRGQQGRPQGRL